MTRLPFRGLWRRGPARAELILVVWETFSALLFVSSIVNAALSSPYPGLIFAGTLFLSWRVSRRLETDRGQVLAAMARIPAWLLSTLPIVGLDYRIVVATLAFGLMAAAIRRAVYRRELSTELNAAKSTSTAADYVRKRLGESPMVAGILGGHMVVIFSVAFLRTESIEMLRGWWQVVPVLGVFGTAVFTLATRHLTRPVTDAITRGPSADAAMIALAVDRARRLPSYLSYLNFGLWVTCTTVGVFYFGTQRERFRPADAIMQLAFAALFSLGVSFFQRNWDKETLAPIERRLMQWLRAEGDTVDRSPPVPTISLRQRMLSDFGWPLLFTAALSLLSSISLYRSLGRGVSVKEDLASMLALVAAFLMLVLAVGAVVFRVARELSRPLALVAQGAELVAQGKLDAALPEASGPAEMLTLIRSVERMRDNLARTIAELEEERKSLEANVEARTIELTRTLRELTHAQAALIQGERLAMLGELMAGIAHEIYNPINAVAGSAEPLERVVEDVRKMLDVYRAAESELPPASRERIAELRRELDLESSLDDLTGISSLVKRATNRTVRIVQNLRNFSRAPGELLPTDLHAGIEETLSLLGGRLRQSCIAVTKDFGPLPLTHTSAGEMNQVFMNLIMNAIQALEMETPADAAQGTKEIVIRSRVMGENCELSFEDNGPGVASDVAPRIFDPFFTTKPRGQGTGLGLSMSSEIVRKLGGTLSLERGSTGGARFVVSLPIEPISRPSMRKALRSEPSSQEVPPAQALRRPHEQEER